MGRVQGDDADAFAALFDRHADRAFRVARSVCSDSAQAEDAVQEGFLSIWRSRGSFRMATSSFQAWAMSIVRNRAIDSNRRANAGHRPRTVDFETARLPDVGSWSPEDEVIARGDEEKLRVSLSRLPEAQAEVIALAFLGELTHTEIAMHLALPEGTVKGRMRLGLENLRSQLTASA